MTGDMTVPAAVRRRTTFAAVLLAVSAGTGVAAPAWAAPAWAAATTTAESRAVAQARKTAAQSLGARVDAALSSGGATTVGAAVDVDGLGTVVRRDAGHLLPPASTQKSFTGVAALLALTPDMRYRTEAAAKVAAVDGVLNSNLWLVASGDPYFTKAGLRVLARGVRAAGVTLVAGDLVLDDSRYDSRRSAAGWKSTFVPNESGPLSAFAVDGNRWRRDGVYVADPALPAAALFRDYLKAEGVAVKGVVRRGIRPPDAAVSVATHISGPLSAVVRRILKDSDNFAAELLLKEVGRVVRGDGSSAGGHAAVVQLLAARGVRAGSGADGSGLSAHDRQNAVGQLALLRVADQSQIANAFRTALPVACQDGTLQSRMCNTAAVGRVFAKTGTLPGVRALSGFTTTASGRTVWFSFQLTGVKDGIQARNALDRAAVVLASAQE
jgi:D-alanyl-D-alanine carboxypeptidase/D-alanyl-D-alanine-endopeptidase (penicillin-binding protein 4)